MNHSKPAEEITHKKYWWEKFSLVIIVILLASMIIWTAFDSIKNSNPNYAAKVGDIIITQEQFAAQYDKIKKQLKTEEITDGYRNFLTKNILAKMVFDAQIDQEMKESGFTPSDEILLEYIKKDPQIFPDPQQFSLMALDNLLQANGITKKELFQIKKRTVFIESFSPIMQAISPDAMEKIDNIMLLNSEVKNYDILTVPASFRANIPVPTEADLRAIYNDKIADYTSNSEEKTFTYFAVNPATVSVAVTDQDVQDYYRNNYQNKLDGDIRSLYIFDFTDELAAKSALFYLKNQKKSPAEVQTILGRRKSEVFFEKASKIDLNDDIKDIAFRQPLNMPSDIIQARSGFFIVVPTASFKPDSNISNSIKEEIKTKLIHDKKCDKISRIKADIRSMVLSSTPIGKIATQFGFKPVSKTITTQQHNTDSIPQIAVDLALDPTTKVGTSDIFEERSECSFLVFALQESKKTPSKLFEDVKSDLMTIYQKEALTKEREKIVEDLYSKLLAATPDKRKAILTSSAISGIKVTSNLQFNRQQKHTMQPSTVNNLIAARQYDVLSPFLDENGNQNIILVTKIYHKKTDKADFNVATAFLQKDRSADIVELYRVYLNKKYSPSFGVQFSSTMQ